MKNIILIDLSSFALDSIMSLEDIYIPALVVDIEEQVSCAKEKYSDRIGKIYYRTSVHSHLEFMNLHKNDYSLSYDDVEKYRTAQVKVEQYLHREVLDYNEIQYRYYSGLQYWLEIFKNNKIDAVISMHPEHGGLWDSLPLEIAKINNIPVFVQEPILGNYDNACYSFRCLNNGETINLEQVSKKYKKMKIEDYVFNKKVLTLNQKKGFKLGIGDFVARWKDSLLRFFWKYVRYQVGFLFLSKKEKFNKRNKNFQQWYNITPKELFFNNIYIRNLRKTYQNISTKISDDKNENYIFYALHFDPEASTMNRAVISNQLYIIKMLSESLPDGWKLYVKEHPHQFNLKNLLAYMLKTIFYFRTESFYKTILEFENVELINLDVTSEKLMEKAKAVVTICGTIALEAITRNKPLLLFGGDLTILGKLKDVFGIKSKQDIAIALEKIKNGFEPDYSDLQQKMSEYVYESLAQELCKQPGEKDYLIEFFSYLTDKAKPLDKLVSK